MARVSFTPNLQRHLDCPAVTVEAATVAAALRAVFEQNPSLEGYVLDEQGRLRKHMNIFVNGAMIRDRVKLGDRVGQDAEIYVLQALSGG